MKNSGSRQSSPQLRRPQRQSESGFGAEPVSTAAWAEVAPPEAGSADFCDLRREGANMLRLAEAQQRAQNPLDQSSRQARAVLGQF